MTAVYHAIASTHTWCGIDATGAPEEGGNKVVLLIAPDRASVTCPDCLAAMPNPPQSTRVTAVVRERMAAQQPADVSAESGNGEEVIDRSLVAERAHKRIQEGR